MEYAIQLLLPILAGLWLGNWLSRTYGLPPIWTLVLAILGMMLGLGILYKRYALSPRPPVIRHPKNGDSSEKRAELHELDFLYKNNDDDSPHDTDADSNNPIRHKPPDD